MDLLLDNFFSLTFLHNKLEKLDVNSEKRSGLAQSLKVLNILYFNLIAQKTCERVSFEKNIMLLHCAGS